MYDKICRTSSYIDPHNYLLMTLDGKILGGLSEHERLKPEKYKNKSRQCSNFAQLKNVMDAGLKI